MTQEFVTLQREVVEKALERLEDNISYDFNGNPYEESDELMHTAAANLRAALEQPDTEITTSLPAGWKLVPVEPTHDMQEAGIGAHYEAEKKMQEPNAWEPGGFAKRKVRASHVYRAMISAAPEPQNIK